MFSWLLLLIAYLPFQIALNPWVWLGKLGLNLSFDFDLASLRIFIILFFIIWLGKVIIGRFSINRVYFKNLQVIGLFLFLLLAGFSLIGAENTFWGLRKIIFFLSVFPLYFLVVALVNSLSPRSSPNEFVLAPHQSGALGAGLGQVWSKTRKVIFILVASSALIALIGLVQFLAPFVFGLDKIYEFWTWQIMPVFSGFNFGALIMAYPSWLVNVDDQVILRAFSLFSDPHMLSFYLGLILPLLVVLFLKVPKKFLLFIVYCLLFIVLLLTFTRGAYLAIIVTFLVLAGLLWKYLKAKKLALLLCLSLLIFIIPVSPIADRFYSSFDMSEGSNVGRLEMWQQAGRVGLEHPWQGIGLGNYSLFVEPSFGYRNPITAHNLYLDIFSEMGILGLLVWLFLILGTMGQLFWKMKNINQEQRYLYLGLIGSLIYFSAHSFFETAIYNPPLLALLMVILGLSTLAVKVQRKI